MLSVLRVLRARLPFYPPHHTCKLNQSAALMIRLVNGYDFFIIFIASPNCTQTTDNLNQDNYLLIESTEVKSHHVSIGRNNTSACDQTGFYGKYPRYSTCDPHASLSCLRALMEL